MLVRLFALTLVFTLATPLSAALYSWRDSGGVTHISDQPPGAQAGDAAPQVKKIEVLELTTVNTRRLPQTPVDLSRLSGEENEQPTAQPTLTLYTTEWCGICKNAKQYMAQEDAPYVEKDIEASLEARHEFRELGGDGVPLFRFGARVMAGFSRDAFEAFYAH